MKIITPRIWLISLISLFNDIGSEMLIPVLPLYFKSIGFSIVFIGVLEGIAEATAGLSKGYFGRLSDSRGTRMPFVRLGYGLSAIAKPMMGFLAQPAWVFLARTVDRLGKGIRTGARDALLSAETSPEHKGRVFGFHRALDTTGAFIGPIIALLFMSAHPNEYSSLFIYAAIPGIATIFLTFLLKERRADHLKVTKGATLFAAFEYVRRSPKEYKRLLWGLLTFALFNSSDVFLLLMVKQSGASDTTVIGLYIFYNAVYAMLGYPMGALGDRIGLRRTFAFGAAIFAMVYAGMAMADGMIAFGVLFLLYGIYAAMNEGIVKAWICNVVSADDTATAIGTFAGFNSMFALLASVIAGAIWSGAGPAAMFMVSAIGVAGVAVYFLISEFGFRISD